MGSRYASDMFKERQKLRKTCKWLIFKNVAVKTKKCFLRNFWENLYWEMIFFTVIFSKFCKKFKSSHQRCSKKKDAVKNFVILTEKQLGWSLFLKSCRTKGLQLYWKETPTQLFSCEYFEIFKNTYFKKHLWTIASVNSRTVIFQEGLVLPFKLNALTSGISWQHMHSNLVGIFSQFWQ